LADWFLGRIDESSPVLCTRCDLRHAAAVWLYFAGPIIGALVAVPLYRLIRGPGFLQPRHGKGVIAAASAVGFPASRKNLHRACI
jgi:hypothetical protein